MNLNWLSISLAQELDYLYTSKALMPVSKVPVITYIDLGIDAYFPDLYRPLMHNMSMQLI